MPKKLKKTTDEIVEEVINSEDREILSRELDYTKLVSTGSTLLDLSICGEVVRGGGLPVGIVVEVFGPESSGKTSILSEIAGNIQANGGDVDFKDPEGRYDKVYAQIYGVELEAENYSRPDTVEELFEGIEGWKPNTKKKGAFSAILADSLAALSTIMEMGDDDNADAYGMARGKAFSKGFRKTCRKIANEDILMVCSNQEREGPKGKFVPGGKAVPYYSTVRIRIAIDYTNGKITKRVKFGEKGTVFEETIGIRSTCTVKKNTAGIPYRKAPICIIFNYGIDDIRANLQWCKTITGSTSYDCVDGKTYVSMEKAIQYIENNDLELQLKEKTIDLWEEYQEAFKVERKTKVRK